jgi:vacuole morphology and inheritance protein 14
MTVAILMQLDRAIQLLESPAFVQLRLHLCNPSHPEHADLLGALYGILMVLPQSTAFHTLRDRLTSVTSLHIGLAMSAMGSAPASAKAKTLSVDVPALLSRYTSLQVQRATRSARGDASRFEPLPIMPVGPESVASTPMAASAAASAAATKP